MTFLFNHSKCIEMSKCDSWFSNEHQLIEKICSFLHFCLNRLDSTGNTSGNYRILLSLRFYVKSIFGVLELQNWHFNIFRGYELAKLAKSEPLKWQIQHF